MKWLTAVYLDADNNAAVFNELSEWSAIVCVLVEGFMEEDDPADTAVDALVGCEEQLAVATPVLLCVLNPDGVQTLSHAACRRQTCAIIHTNGLSRAEPNNCLMHDNIKCS